MEDFYRFIKQLALTQNTAFLTVLEGPHAAEKAVLQDGKWIFKEPGGFFDSISPDEIIPGEQGVNETGSTENEAAGSQKRNPYSIRDGIVSVHGTKIYVELPGSRKHMVICGGGNVSLCVVRLAKMTGFYVTVLEDRLTFADQAKEAGADEVILDQYAEGLNKIPGSPDTYFVIVTRGHRFDEECLMAILSKPFAYVGMMGSRKRTDLIRSHILAQGISFETAELLHAPIGLSIHAQTPAEIAVSILAEIIGIKNEHGTREGYPEEILEALTGRSGPMVLMTIIEKKGSAPRSVGTKMLLLPDGTTIGTIGGGCMEAEILSAARSLMKRCGEPSGEICGKPSGAPSGEIFDEISGAPSNETTGSTPAEISGQLTRRSGTAPLQICSADLMTDLAEEEGMVCGGRIQVLLELK